MLPVCHYMLPVLVLPVCSLCYLSVLPICGSCYLCLCYLIVVYATCLCYLLPVPVLPATCACVHVTCACVVHL